jgi:probable F420-dependent oxidoreductase
MGSVGFGLSSARAETADDWLSQARRADEVGYEILHVPDHLGALSPAAAMAAAAAVTDRIGLGAYVLNNDFRHPLLVAQEAATVDLISEGRLELGMGAGWNVPEYNQAGITFDPASRRIARLEESVTILRRLFAGETVSFSGEHYTITDHSLTPLPPQGADLPVTIGGNGDRLLGVAARHADIIGFTGFTIRPSGPVMSHFTPDRLAERIELVRDRAGDRFAGLRLSVLVQHAVVTDDAEKEAGRLAAEWAEDTPNAPDRADILASPFVLIGNVDEILDQAEHFAQTLGLTRFTVFARRSEGFDAVVREAAARAS